MDRGGEEIWSKGEKRRECELGLLCKVRKDNFVKKKIKVFKKQKNIQILKSTSVLRGNDAHFKWRVDNNCGIVNCWEKSESVRFCLILI